MKHSDINKLQKVVRKIESGTFDEMDVDQLFLKLREHSGSFHLFREIADSVAFG